ncbi:MAG TPA: HNH endonuclease signature motif containing protein [Gemmatimonadaceae bacterium]|jgi:5-methylcytosine-specific restriction endonuclease McrA
MSLVSREMRERIWNRDKRRCHYCHRRLAFEEMTLDHAIPHSKGGNRHYRNLVASCAVCNRAKGDLTEYEWWSLPTEEKERRKDAVRTTYTPYR